ncbi:hypothetical protein, partial [Acinetobacter baumannii]|uniref:hypothetical protein n=1 Tax=Acinetobacter baumannii TaxID=470 RepID=UPI001C07BE20
PPFLQTKSKQITSLEIYTWRERTLDRTLLRMGKVPMAKTITIDILQEPNNFQTNDFYQRMICASLNTKNSQDPMPDLQSKHVFNVKYFYLK